MKCPSFKLSVILVRVKLAAIRELITILVGKQVGK